MMSTELIEKAERAIPEGKKFLTVSEATTLLQGVVGRGTIYKMVKTGQVKHRRIMKRIVISRADLMGVLEGQPSDSGDNA